MEKRIFGYELILDLSGCDRKIFISKTKLQEFVDRLCKLIKMQKFGETILHYFGEKEEFTKGYSLVQFVETSSITGHFSELWERAYINIFSCKMFDYQEAKEFTKKYFRAKKDKSKFIVR